MYTQYTYSLVLLFVLPIVAMEMPKSSQLSESHENIWQVRQWEIDNMTHSKRELILHTIAQDLAAMKKEIMSQSTATDIDLEYITTHENSVRIGLNMLTTINEQSAKAVYVDIDKFICTYIMDEASYKKIGKLYIKNNKRIPIITP